MIVQRESGPARLAILIAASLTMATGLAGYVLVDTAMWVVGRI